MRRILLLLLLAGAVYAMVTEPGRTPPASQEASTGTPAVYTPAPPDPAQEARVRKLEAMAAVSLRDVKPTTEFSVMTVSFTITNPVDSDIKDFTVRCEHLAASGTVIDQNTRTIYEIVPARGTKTIRNFNMGFHSSQAKRSACSVTDLVVDTYRAPPPPKTIHKPSPAR